MVDDSGTQKVSQEDLKDPKKLQAKEALSKDEIDSIADLISDDSQGAPVIDLDDTGRFTR